MKNMVFHQPPGVPELRNPNRKVWYRWVNTWCWLLLNKLENAQDDAVVEILLPILILKSN